MSKYVTTRQYEPLKTPENWGTGGKRFVQQVQDALDDIRARFGRIKVTDLNEGLRKEYNDALGNITTLELDASGLKTRVENAEGNISSLGQTATGIETRVQSAEGNISSLQQTATGIQTRVENAEGNISSLQQTATEINATVSSIAVGGRNLLRDSGTAVPETSSYLLKTYALSDTLTAGETVTLTIWGTLGTGKTSFAVTDGDGSPAIAGLSTKADGKYTATFAWPTGLDGTAVSVYGYPSGTGTASISKIKLERGNKATDWTPAPEDIDARVSAAELKITDSAIVQTVRSSTAYTADQNALSTAAGNAQSAADAANTAIGDNNSGLTKRVREAELKITDSAIVQTVRSSSAYTADQAGKLGVNDAAKAVQTATSELTDSHFLVSFDGKTAMEVTAEEARFDTDVTSANRFVGNIVNTQGGITKSVSGNTIQPYLDSLGKYLTGDVTIGLYGNVYQGFTVSGFFGPGTLTVYFNPSAVVVGNIVVLDCSCRVRLIAAAGSRTERQLRPQSGYAVTVNNAQVEMLNIGIQGRIRTSASDQGCNGILAQNGARVSVTDCLIERTYIPVYATTLSRVYISGLIGGVSGGDYATVNNMSYWLIIASGASAQVNAGAVPVCDKGAYATNGFSGDVVISSGGVTATGSDGTAPVVSSKTVSFTAAGGYYTKCASGKTYGNGWLGDGTSTPMKGRAVAGGDYGAGLWLMNAPASIASTLAGKTIKSAAVTIKRTASSGTTNSANTVKLYYHGLETVSGLGGVSHPYNVANNSAYADRLIDTGADAQYIANGESVSYALPSAMYALLQSGACKGFGVGGAQDAGYMRFEPATCELNVVYE